MRRIIGFILFVFGSFLFALSIDRLGTIGNFIMHMCALMIAFKGARWMLNRRREVL